jgi:glycerophosphoryl diester phosphodiesterase
MVHADRLIAHRGWQTRFPENTLPALRGALNRGARHLECDVQLSADGLPLLCHDPTLQRLCGVDVDITTLRAAEALQLSAHEPGRLGVVHHGTPLATLEQAVGLCAAYPGVTLYVELKRHSLRRFGADRVLDAVLPVVAASAARIVLISFDVAVLLRARERAWARSALVLSDWEQAFSADVRALQPALLFGSIAWLAAHRLSELPSPVAVYEVPTAEAARDWWQRGAALVETFAIGELLESLTEEGHG